MSMGDAPENNLPATGLRLSGDAAREIAALRTSYAACERQVAELTDHNTELLGVLETVRAWCLANAKAARNRAAQTGDSDWLIRQRVISEVWELVKPIS
jgi:hypothetical protein